VKALLKPTPAVLRSNPEVGTVPDSAEAAASKSAEERDWIARARGGDAQAYRCLVERYSDRAYGLAFRMLGSAPEAEEVAQDALVRAWRALPRFRGDSSFSTWLHRIVVRRALDRSATLKERRLREAPLEELGPAEPIGPESEDAAGREQLSHRLGRLLESLSDVQRAAVMLYYYEDRSVDEVATVLGIPEGTVKTHLHRARGLLRAGWMEEERRGGGS
jgi:RNA polymerase sigma-70 factor (ECF subfamily)